MEARWPIWLRRFVDWLTRWVVCEISPPDLLAREPRGLLPVFAPRSASMAMDRRPYFTWRHHRHCASKHKGTIVPDRWLAVVLGNAGAGNRIGEGRRPGNGGSFTYIPSMACSSRSSSACDLANTWRIGGLIATRRMTILSCLL